MKKIALFILFCLPSIAISADFGIAGSVGQTPAVRLSIKTNSFLFEPYISYNKQERKQSLQTYAYESSTLGLGIWKIQTLSEKMYAQYGAKLGYIQVTPSKVSYSEAPESESDGFEFAPNFGLFYRISEKFDAGLEAEYNYLTLDAKQGSDSYSRVDLLTSATARLYF